MEEQTRPIEEALRELEKMIGSTSDEVHDVILRIYDSLGAEVDELLADSEKTETMLLETEMKFAAKAPSGKALAYIPLLLSLTRNYLKGEYTGISADSVHNIVMGLKYYLADDDMLRDTLPFVGYMDDNMLMAGCLYLSKADLDRYVEWKKENGLSVEVVPGFDEVLQDAKKSVGKLMGLFGK